MSAGNVSIYMVSPYQRPSPRRAIDVYTLHIACRPRNRCQVASHSHSIHAEGAQTQTPTPTHRTPHIDGKTKKFLVDAVVFPLVDPASCCWSPLSMLLCVRHQSLYMRSHLYENVKIHKSSCLMLCECASTRVSVFVCLVSCFVSAHISSSIVVSVNRVSDVV